MNDGIQTSNEQGKSMRNKTKKIFIILGVVILLFLVFIVIGIVRARILPEKETMRYFESNREVLQEGIRNYETTREIPKGEAFKAIYWNGEHPIIQYDMVTKGWLPSAKYYGFFYSFDDVPVAFQNGKDALIPISGNEWEWKGRGDNRGIVRKIESNWFYFEASF